MDAKIETLVKAYVRIRDDLGAKRKEFKKVEADAKRQLDMIELELKKRADDLGVDSFKTTNGTAFKTTKDFVAVKDWNLTIKFILDNNLTNMFNKSVNKTAVKEYMAENNNALPPGVEYGQKVEIQVRR